MRFMAGRAARFDLSLATGPQASRRAKPWQEGKREKIATQKRP